MCALYLNTCRLDAHCNISAVFFLPLACSKPSHRSSLLLYLFSFSQSFIYRFVPLDLPPVTYRITAYLFPYAAPSPTFTYAIVDNTIKNIGFPDLAGQGRLEEDTTPPVTTTGTVTPCSGHRFCPLSATTGNAQFCTLGNVCVDCAECDVSTSINGICPSKCNGATASPTTQPSAQPTSSPPPAVYTLDVAAQPTVEFDPLSFVFALTYDVAVESPLIMKATLRRESDRAVLAHTDMPLGSNAGNATITLVIHDEFLPLAPGERYQLLTYVFIEGSPLPHYNYAIVSDLKTGIEVV